MALVDNLYIYVVDGSQGLWDNPADWLDSAVTVGDITVTSVTDMVDKILVRVGTRRIQNLFIGGHGCSGYQCVGAGTAGDGTGARSLRVDPSTGLLLGPAETQLRRLRGRFNASNPICTLGGCQVASGTAGPILLKAVSSALGVPVQAGTTNQRPLFPGMEGDVIRCTATACTNLGGGSWWSSPGSWVQ